MLISEKVENLSWELRDHTMNIRMLPVGTIFNKYRRLVRDLASSLGKEVDLEITGSETEIDKTIIEKLSDPLLHIIRNSIDHGLELPAVRESLGKPRKGTIRLAASHSGADICIDIEDDGAGINLEKVKDIIQDAWTCDISKAMNEIGYRESIKLEKGIRETVAWYKENNWLK